MSEASDSVAGDYWFNQLEAENKRLRVLNAELVEALKRTESFLVSYHGPETRWVLDEIRAALAKAVAS
jgi:hypothetical protein